LANRELDKDTAAFTDLERSVELLPTAPAHFALGSLAEERGNYDDAIEHYRVVAKSGGDYGKAATAALAKLDLPQNPASYIPRRCGADSNGNLVVSVQNQVNVTIAGVQVAVQYTDAAGRTQRSVHAIRGNLAPGEVASVNTGLGPYTGGSCPAEVVAARIVE
jgi:lipopolysaccharide biosynthesis regulator YciM